MCVGAYSGGCTICQPPQSYPFISYDILSYGGSENRLGTPKTSQGTPKNSLGTSKNALGTPKNGLGTPTNSMGISENSLGTPKVTIPWVIPNLSDRAPSGIPKSLRLNYPGRS